MAKSSASWLGVAGAGEAEPPPGGGRPRRAHVLVREGRWWLLIAAEAGGVAALLLGPFLVPGPVEDDGVLAGGGRIIDVPWSELRQWVPFFLCHVFWLIWRRRKRWMKSKAKTRKWRVFFVIKLCVCVFRPRLCVLIVLSCDVRTTPSLLCLNMHACFSNFSAIIPSLPPFYS